ncbi:MAG: hypothetical protein OEV86_15945 [Candidatus Krumholzibacteria bacterium]|nr:hypothetical protein [Candidatus Krumholzibacteria bacterium]
MPDTTSRKPLLPDANYPDLDNIEWVPEYMVQRQIKAAAEHLAHKVLEPFIARLQERPGEWAVYAKGRKSCFPSRRITDPTLRLYTQVRNSYDRESKTFTIYMRWTGGRMKQED